MLAVLQGGIPVLRIPDRRVPRGRLAVVLLLVVAAGPLAAVAAAQQSDIRIRDPYFEWVDADAQVATFEWSVELVSTMQEPQRVRVVLELLDEDDQNVEEQAPDRCRAANNTQELTVQPGTTVQVTQRGNIPYDCAAEVVTFRARRELLPPQ